MNDRLQIIVMGWIVRGPLGGMAWHYLQYVLGLARLGHDVYFAEDSWDLPSCYHPETFETDADPREGLEFARRAFDGLGLGDRWAYFDAHTDAWMGPAAGRMLKLARDTDLLLNVSGVNLVRPWFMEIPVRTFVDTDPVFTQIHNLTDEAARSRALQHNTFLTFGENVSRNPLPDDGLSWRPTRQPIVLDVWPVTPGPRDGAFTTVMQWDSYGAREHNGIRYEMKSASFQAFIDMPKRTSATLELSMPGADGSPARLRELGWTVTDGRSIRDPWVYQRYLQHSKAEFSLAKHGYALSRCGWFSERSAAYLASGRPVILQDTGLSEWLPTGHGVFSFASPDEATAAIDEVNAGYVDHCRAAREIAETYFDARRVLPRVLEQVMEGT